MEPDRDRHAVLESFTAGTARQLIRQFPFMKFSRGLEREFRKSYSKLIIPRFRIAVVSGFILILTFEAVDRLSGTHAIVTAASVIRLGIILPGLAIAGAATYIKKLREHIMPFILMAVLLAGLGIVGVFLVNYHGSGRVRYESLMLITAIVYFVTGLLIRMTVVCSLSVMFAYVIGCVVTGVNAELTLYSSVYLTLMNIIGAGGCYIIELTIRSNYLQRKNLRYLAEHDGLTGIYNRHTFNETYIRLWRQAARDGKAIAVMMVDVDFFKLYNDTYGHLEGDRCLQKIAAVLAQYVRRPLDIVSRYGGEEFVVVWYDAVERRAHEMSEEFRAGIEALGIRHRTSKACESVTVSVGCAMETPFPGGEPEELINRADTALYRAKRKGRNRVVFTPVPRLRQAARSEK
jgi:diguanylate cyclase (GGDEF)-like protein